MERQFSTFLFCMFLLFTMQGIGNDAPAYGMKTPIRNQPFTDSVVLPECIKKLSGPGKAGIRSSMGAKQYLKTHTLKNGKTLYVFSARASIGCHINDPAGTKYYNDSCNMVASFPANFSIKKGFRPYIAKGYSPDDFPEAALGDYPAYFANQEKEKLTPKIIKSNAPRKDPFPVEKGYAVTSVDDDVLKLKKGDIIRISTKNGLKHYRTNKLVNNYKLIPQHSLERIEAQCRVPPCFITETKVVVYYVDQLKRFVTVRNNALLISASRYQQADTPTKDIELSWKTAYGLIAK